MFSSNHRPVITTFFFTFLPKLHPMQSLPSSSPMNLVTSLRLETHDLFSSNTFQKEISKCKLHSWFVLRKWILDVLYFAKWCLRDMLIYGLCQSMKIGIFLCQSSHLILSSASHYDLCAFFPKLKLCPREVNNWPIWPLLLQHTHNAAQCPPGLITLTSNARWSKCKMYNSNTRRKVCISIVKSIP